MGCRLSKRRSSLTTTVTTAYKYSSSFVIKPNTPYHLQLLTSSTQLLNETIQLPQVLIPIITQYISHTNDFRSPYISEHHVHDCLLHINWDVFYPSLQDMNLHPYLFTVLKNRLFVTFSILRYCMLPLLTRYNCILHAKDDKTLSYSRVACCITALQQLHNDNENCQILMVCNDDSRQTRTTLSFLNMSNSVQLNNKLIIGDTETIYNNVMNDGFITHHIQCIIFDNKDDNTYWVRNQMMINELCSKLSSYRHTNNQSDLQVIFRSRLVEVDTSLFTFMNDAVNVDFSFKAQPTE